MNTELLYCIGKDERNVHLYRENGTHVYLRKQGLIFNPGTYYFVTHDGINAIDILEAYLQQFDQSLIKYIH